MNDDLQARRIRRFGALAPGGLARTNSREYAATRNNTPLGDHCDVTLATAKVVSFAHQAEIAAAYNTTIEGVRAQCASRQQLSIWMAKSPSIGFLVHMNVTADYLGRPTSL